MPIQNINTGSSANAGNGDSIRLAFDKVNRNFSFVQTNLNSLSAGNFTSLRVATTSTLNNLTVTGTTYLNSVESASFYNNTYLENIIVSDKSILNHVTATDVTVTGNAKIDTLDVLTSLSVGSYQIAAINDYNDFSIVKNDATGLAVVLLNTNADSNSKLVVKDNISGGLAILHQNLTNLAGDFIAGENYIYGETPTDVIHIGAYSDLKFSASEAKYYDPALPETPSMVIQSIDGAVHVYSSATFHSDVYGITGAGANAGTLDRLTSQDLSKVVTLNNNGSLVPSANLAYDLGSTSSQWRSLYVGTSTIYLGGTALSIAGGNITIDGNPIQTGAGDVWQLTSGTSVISLNTSGSLTLPQGSYIDETAAPLGTAKSLDLHPGDPIYPTQYLRIYPTNGGDADHLHLTSGDLTATELFLGDDEQYVKLTNTGNVEIRTGAFDYYNDTKGVWTFDSDGVLTLPTHNATLGSRIKSAVDITIETGRYYLVDLVSVGGGGVVDGPGAVDFLISSAPDWETAVAVGDHVVSGTWTDIITDISNLGEGRWRIEFASSVFSGATNTYSFYKPGAAGGTWTFDTDGKLTLPGGQSIGSGPSDGIKLTTDRGTVLFGNTPEQCVPTLASHFHIMRDDPTTVDLFFGDDLNYVKLPYDSTLTNVGVQIGTDATNLWSFGKDGVLTLPSGNTRIGNVFGEDAIVANTGTGVGVLSRGQGGYAALQWIDNPEDATSVAAIVVNSPIASTSGTVQIATGLVGGPTAENVWEFGADGNLTVPDDIQDANGSVIRVASTSTAPTRVNGQLWFNNAEGRLYIKNNGLWLDASPTQIPSPETYLDGLAIDGTVISTANVDGDAIVIDAGNNNRLTVGNNSVTIQVHSTSTVGDVSSWWSMYGDLDRNISDEFGAGSVYDGDGNLYVVGTFQTEGPDNLLLIKYDSTGQVLWSKSYANNSVGGPGGGSQIYGESIIFDSVSGHLFILTTQETSWFGIIEMTTAGNIVRWVHGDTEEALTGTDLTIDPSGNIYVMANVGTTDGGQGTDYLIIKLDATNLDVVWAKSLDYGETVDEPYQGQGFGALEYSNGYIYATGAVGGGGGNLAYLVKLDATDGSLDWGTDAQGVVGMGLCLDDNDNVYITLTADNEAGFSAIAKFNSSGTFQWAQQLMLFQGGGDVDINYDLGYLYATGVVYDERAGGPSYDGSPGWIHWAKVNATTGDIVYQQKFGNATNMPLTDVWRFYGHDLGGVYDGRLSISAFAYESTGTSGVAANMITLQLPLTYVTTGTYGQYEITDFVTTSTSFTTTNSFTAGIPITVDDFVLFGSETFTEGSTSTVVVDNTLTFYTQAIGEISASITTSTVSTWTFVNNNIILPPGGDILDSNGVSVLGGATTSTIALPSWITVVADTNHFPTLNVDYGWDSSGAWSANATILENDELTSFPFRTTFSIPNDTKSVTTVDFVVNEIDESDFGIAVFASGDTPEWVWGELSVNTISAKYTPTELYGISGSASTNDWTPPSLGTYRARLTVEPTGPGTADIMLETLDTSNNILDTISYTETEFFGTDYKIGFASDNDGGVNKTYFKNLTIDIGDGATVYTDTLMNGSSTGGTTTALGDRLTAGNSSVVLGTDGVLTLPDGGTIAVGMGAIQIKPAGASSATQALLIYPTTQDGNHIHLTAMFGGTTDLYLGNDDQFVKVDHGGDIVVGTYSTATTSTWTFGTDGVLTLPNDMTIDASVSFGIVTIGGTSTYISIDNGGAPPALTIATNQGENAWQFGYDGVLTLSTASTILGSGTDPNVYIETATTSTTSTWTFGTDGVLTLPAATPVIKGGGTGTDVTVIATTGTNTATWVFGASGAVTFPDSTVQTTAYVPATASASTYTGWFKAAGTVVQLDTLLARINSTGTMQISSTIVESIGDGAAFAWNGVRNKGATMSSFGQGEEAWVMPGDWLDISATPLDNDFEVATVSVFKLGGTGSLYRITYVGSTNSRWAVNIERVALG